MNKSSSLWGAISSAAWATRSDMVKIVDQKAILKRVVYLQEKTKLKGRGQKKEALQKKYKQVGSKA
jgi:hypothetical protein